MAGYIEDRWWTKRPDPATGKKRKTARYGQGKRYRVAGIPGVKDRSFEAMTGPAGANAWKAKAEHESAKGEFVDPRAGNLLLGVYVDDHWWPNKTGDIMTLENVEVRVRKHIVPHLGDLPLNAIQTPQLRSWLKGLESQIGASTISEVWGTLAGILQAAVEDGRIPKNYCRCQSTVRPPPIPERIARAWSKRQVVAVRESLPARYQIMVDLGVGAGLREGEVFGLAEDDIDAAAGVLHIRRQVKRTRSKLIFSLPKGHKTRTVPVPPYLLSALQEHLRQFPAQKVTLPWGHPDPPQTDKEARERAPRTFALVVTGLRGGALRRGGWDSSHWKPALAAAGVIGEPKVIASPLPSYRKRTVVKYPVSRENGFHSLRHTFASVQLDAREPIVAVSKWLGHADPSITLRIYAHMMPEADGRGRAAMQAWFEDQ